jgi:hypothetical protein
MITKRFDKKLIAHSGGLPGCATLLERYPEPKVFVVALCNLEGSAHSRVCRDLAAIALGQPYDIPIEHKEIKIDAKSLDAFVGEYELKPKQILTITKRDDNLFAQVTGQGRFPLAPESDTKFFARAEEATIAFIKDDKGAVTELVLHQGGGDQKAKRLPPKPPEKKDEKTDEKKEK